MKRQALWSAPAVVLLLLSGACNRDTTTGVPVISAKLEGSSRPLHDDIAFFTRQFSPVDGGLAVMNSDGSARRPLPGGELGFEPAISPDGRRIAFSRNTDVGVTSVYVMNVDGSGTTSIVQDLVFNPGPVWSPDGCQIAFRSSPAGPTGPVGRISIVNADGTGLRQVSPDDEQGSFDESPTWSPDGTRLAFTRNSVLHVINVDGTGMTALPNEDMAGNPSWSPDGRRIAYWGFTPPGIHLRNADGSNLVYVTNDPEAFDFWPRWSPDGGQLVISRYVVAQDQAQVVTLNLDGSGAVSLTPAGVNDYMPDWSHHPTSPPRCGAGGN